MTVATRYRSDCYEKLYYLYSYRPNKRRLLGESRRILGQRHHALFYPLFINIIIYLHFYD